jgi:hypothetical protein
MQTETSHPRDNLEWFKRMTYIGLVLSVVAWVIIAGLAIEITTRPHPAATSEVTLAPINITGQLIIPPSTLSDAPPIFAQQPFGQRLTNINVPFNSTQLAEINDEPAAYYDTAAQMWLNGSITSTVGQSFAYSPLFTVNGKPAVMYLGAISCVYCGENRWAMALALSQFGSFTNLFFGYSALLDQDVPTIYWSPAEYNSSSAVEFGNFYDGTYVNFLSIEYSSPITGGFEMQNLTYFQQRATAANDPVYEAATNLMVDLNNFDGTPYTIWNNYAVLGADARDFGTASSTSTTTSSNSSSASATLPITSMTHDEILASFAHPTTQFAWTEYAAADYYISLVCSSLGIVSMSSASGPAVCSLPYVSQMSSVVRQGYVNSPG